MGCEGSCRQLAVLSRYCSGCALYGQQDDKGHHGRGRWLCNIPTARRTRGSINVAMRLTHSKLINNNVAMPLTHSKLINQQRVDNVIDTQVHWKRWMYGHKVSCAIYLLLEVHHCAHTPSIQSMHSSCSDGGISLARTLVYHAIMTPDALVSRDVPTGEVGGSMIYRA